MSDKNIKDAELSKALRDNLKKRKSASRNRNAKHDINEDILTSLDENSNGV